MIEYFVRLVYHVKCAIKHFKMLRMFRKYHGILVSSEIKKFDDFELYISVDETIQMIKRFHLDPLTLENIDGHGRKTAAIGFSPKSQKWYGWSHRAVYGFGIGDIVSVGDITASTGYIEEFEESNPEEAFKYVLKPGFEAKTLLDAKKMAVAFASAVA